MARMQYLPRLTCGTRCWQLPLSDATAAMLAEALLVTNSAERQDLYARSLMQDPPWTLWAICRIDELTDSAPTTIQTVADWLVGRALDLLSVEHWDPSPISTCVDNPKRETWADFVYSGVIAAADAEPEQAIARLVSPFLQWLSTTGTPISREDLERGRTCAPEWLIPRLPLSSPTESNRMPRASSVGAATRRDWLATVPGAGRQLAQLVSTLNRLNQLDHQFDQLVEEEKLRSLKQFAYGAGHEINNPLANISIRAQTLLREETDPERKRKLATINSQAFRAHEMIADLMLFAHPPELQCESVNVIDVIERLIDELTPISQSQGTHFQRDPGELSLSLWADATQLCVALRAILTNSLEAIGQGGVIKIRASQIRHQPDQPIGNKIEIQIRDSGPGIAPETRRHIFDPVYSGREAGRGLGLGLSKCWRIITDHGGRIVVESPSTQGATFKIVLPAA